MANGPFNTWLNTELAAAAALSATDKLPITQGGATLYATPAQIDTYVFTGAKAITSTSATAFAVGASGATNPVLNINASTASQVGGISIVGGATGGTTTITATDSGAAHGLTIATKSTSTLTLGTGAAGGNIILAHGGSARLTVSNTQASFAPAGRAGTAAASFLYTVPAGSTLTASTNAPIVNWNFANAVVQQHATGALTLQTDMRIQQATHTAVAASTITDAATLGVDGPPIASTNATITNASAFYTGGTAVSGTVTNSYGLNINASSGATNNYAARFAGSAGEIISLRTDGQISVLNTVTAGGTTGAQTINKPSGTVNFAAAAASLVVTNSLCTTSSIIHAVLRTNDATARVANVVPAAGSFTINLAAAATAETSCGFLIIN